MKRNIDVFEQSERLKKLDEEIRVMMLEGARRATEHRKAVNETLSLCKCLMILEDEYTHPNLLKESLFGRPLCTVVQILHNQGLLTSTESALLLDYIACNRPFAFTSWSAFKSRNSNVYWKIGDGHNRLHWLRVHILKHYNHAS